jgi:biotin carboxyl carrier protein
VKLRMVIDEKSYDIIVGDAEKDSPSRVRARELPPGVPIQSSVLPASNGTDAASGANGNGRVCRSPITGVVARVLAQPGQELQMHDLMLVLEAMKMETHIAAPISGKLKRLNAVAGDAVTVGQILLEFE